MRKILLLLSILFCFAASAQYQNINRNLQYVNTFGYQYERFHAMYLMGLPADTFAVPTLLQNIPFIANKAGSIYLWNISTHVWDLFSSGTSYTDADARAAISLTTTGTSGAATYSSATGVFNIPNYTTTASQGITKVGNDFQLGQAIGGSGSAFTVNRNIDINKKILFLNSGYTPGAGGESGFSPLQFVALDTIATNDPPSSVLPTTGAAFQRVMRFIGGTRAQVKVGHSMGLRYETADSATITTLGGDFGGNLVSNLVLGPLAGTTGRYVFRGGNATLDASEAPFATISDVQFKGSTAGTHAYYRGFVNAHTSYLLMDSGQPDTLENFVFYGGRDFVPAPSKVLKAYFIKPAGSSADSVWLLHDNLGIKSYLTGSVAIGGTTGTATASSLLDVTSTTKGVVWPRMTTTQKNAIASPATGLIVFDTDLVQYNFWDGDSWEAMGGGGSSGITIGSTTITSGTNTRVLFNNSGVVGEYTISGTGNVAMTTTPTFTTNITTPSIIGGTSTTQTLTYKTTTGVGATGADHIFQVGNNGATEAMRILNNGNVGIGISPTQKLHILGNQLITPTADGTSTIRMNIAGGNAGLQFGSYPSVPSYGSIWAGNVTPSGTNYVLAGDGTTETLFNGASLKFRINNVSSPTAMTISTVAGVGINVNSPTAKLHLIGSTTVAGTASIKINEGSRQTTPEDGTINYVSNNLEFVETSTVYTLAKTLTNTATLDFASTGAGAVADLTITVTGAADGDAVTIGVPNGSVTATATYSAWVSAANTVTIRFSPKATEDPASGTFRVSVIKY